MSLKSREQQVTGSEEPAHLIGLPLLEFQSWQYFHMLDRFISTYKYLLHERALNAVCRELGMQEDLALYRHRSMGKTAAQVALFHTLFLSWPKLLHSVLGSSPPPRKGGRMQSVSSPAMKWA